MTTQMGQLQYTRNNEMKGRNFLSLAISMFLLSPGTVLAINDINNNEKLENRDELVSLQDVNNLDQDNEEIGKDELAKEFEDQSGIDSFENEDNGLVRYLASNYTRSGNYVVHGNDDNVYYAYNRVGSTFYLNNGGISTTYKKVREIIDTDTAVQTHVATTLFKEPAFSSKYRTNTTIPAGYYTAKYVAGSFVYVETDYGDGWISTSCDNNGNYISGGRMTFLDVPSSLSVGSVNGIPIYQKIIPRYSDDARAGYSMKPKYITIHNTASSGKGANARAHANLQYNGNNRTASWHYTVDNTEIWQSIPINENSWHAGDGQAMGNCGSVSIEICENSDGNYAQAERNAAYLAARLLYECGLPSDAIRMHRDWSGKNCPHNTIEGTKGTMGWESFKFLVVSAYNSYAQNDRNTSNVVNQGTGKASNAPTIQYNAKTQKIGWQNQVTEPNSTGTTGRSLKIYQLKMNLLNVPYSTHLYGTIKTTAGQKNYDNIENDTLIGIDGKAMTQVNFGLENVPGYHLEYRVHSSNLGWQSWVKQGNKAGDGNNEIQAIDFKLVKDDDIKVTAPKIYYNGHIADKGWLNYVPDSQIGGTVGKSIYLQAFHLGIDNAEEYNLSGKVYVDGKGWQNYDEINPNTVLGTTGQNKAIKAINLNLDLPGYRLEYQVHSSNIGWQNWVKSGQIAGDEKNNIEAIRFRLVEDNSKILQIVFDKNELYMNLNSIYQLKSRIIPENTVMDKTLSWKSDNEEVANVDQNGNITANKVGVAIITATSVNGLTASCKINVIKPITSIKLDNADIIIEKNKEITLGLSIEPMDATESYTWTSSNTNVATVDENGKVIDKWTSSNKAHTIEGLTVGKEYTLREDLAPLGYVKATEIKFKVENTNETQKVVMIDKIVEMTKNDIGGEEIEGAELKVFDKEGNIVDEWTSTNEAHKIKNLVEGKTYTLHEEYAPEGYVIATGSATVQIEKANSTISLSASNGYITVTSNSDGSVSATSSNTGIANVPVTGRSIRIVPVTNGGSGTFTVSVVVNESTNYKASSTATQSVTVSSRLITSSIGWYTASSYWSGYYYVENSTVKWYFDGDSMWHTTDNITLSAGCYYVVGYTGGQPRAILWNNSNHTGLYQAFRAVESEGGCTVSFTGTKYTLSYSLHTSSVDWFQLSTIVCISVISGKFR